MKTPFHNILLILLMLVVTACDKEYVDREFPSVVTLSVVPNGTEAMIFSGKIIIRNSGDIKEIGFIWQSGEDPLTTPGYKINLVNTVKNGKFSTAITSSLKKDTEYFVRAYAVVNDITVYGELIHFVGTGNLNLGALTISPFTGFVGDTIVIRGGLFNSDPERNVVKFNDLEAAVVKILDSTLYCIVPLDLISKESNISLIQDGILQILQTSFQLVSPSLISFTPAEAQFLDTITINGSGFHRNKQFNKVLFGNRPATVLTSSQNQLKVVVPYLIDTLSYITVSVSGQVSTSQNKIIVHQPNFDYFIPYSSGYLDTITIYCRNINPSDINSIFIDIASARIILKTSNIIKFEVPTQLKKEVSDVTIKLASIEIILNEKFHLNQPAINSISNDKILNHQTLTLFGSDFNPVASLNKITIKDIDNDRTYLLTPFYSSPDSLKINIYNQNNSSSLPSGKYTIGVQTCENIFWFNNTITIADKWRQLSNFPGGERYKGAGFSINGKGYAGFGTKLHNVIQKDIWEFNPVTEIWTRQADCPGTARIFPCSFANSSFGFIGGGQSIDNTPSQVPFIDFYKFNPSSNTWTRLQDIPGVDKSYPGASASTGNNKHFANLVSGILYKYTEETNTWSQVYAGLAATNGMPQTFSINNKVYFVCGANSELTNGTNNQVWEFDPATNSMTRKSDFPGTSRYGGFSFSIGNYGYIGCGAYYQLPVTGTYLNDVYRYDPSSDTWQQLGIYPGGIRQSMSYFVIGKKAYILTGYSGSDIISEVWEFYDPDNN